MQRGSSCRSTEDTIAADIHQHEMLFQADVVRRRRDELLGCFPKSKTLSNQELERIV